MVVSASLPIVLDTSVWINVLSTGHAKQIIEAIGSLVYIPEQVLGEIRLDPRTRRPFHPDPHPALESEQALLAPLSPSELDLFVDLVSAPAPDRLGDGEAASIALALSRNCQLGVDERKANRIIKERFSSIQTFRSTDLLNHPLVRDALGAGLADECYDLAVRFGRMHVL